MGGFTPWRTIWHNNSRHVFERSLPIRPCSMKRPDLLMRAASRREPTLSHELASEEVRKIVIPSPFLARFGG